MLSNPALPHRFIGPCSSVECSVLSIWSDDVKQWDWSLFDWVITWDRLLMIADSCFASLGLQWIHFLVGSLVDCLIVPGHHLPGSKPFRLHVGHHDWPLAGLSKVSGTRKTNLQVVSSWRLTCLDCLRYLWLGLWRLLLVLLVIDYWNRDERWCFATFTSKQVISFNHFNQCSRMLQNAFIISMTLPQRLKCPLPAWSDCSLQFLSFVFFWD